MKEKFQTSLQPTVPSTPINHVGVPIQQSQIQLSLVTNPIPVNQHVGWLQPITPLIAMQPRTISYPTWYNSVPSFVLMDPNMYSMHYSKIKGPNPLISRRKKGYVIDVIQLKQVPHVEQLVQNQYPIKIPTLGLEQSDPFTRDVPIPQAMIVTLPINIIVTIGLPIYGNGVPIQQPKKVNSYPCPSGELPRGSLGGGSHDQY